jgi:hypothetical protein
MDLLRKKKEAPCAKKNAREEIKEEGSRNPQSQEKDAKSMTCQLRIPSR